MDFNPRAAIRLAEGLLAAGDGLMDFPYRGRIVPVLACANWSPITLTLSAIVLSATMFGSYASAIVQGDRQIIDGSAVFAANGIYRRHADRRVSSHRSLPWVKATMRLTCRPPISEQF